jgi:hypothetical protein
MLSVRGAGRRTQWCKGCDYRKPCNPAHAMTISLKEITRATLREICRLDAGDGRRQVAPNALSIAEASFHDEAWFRAIYDDETPVTSAAVPGSGGFWCRMSSRPIFLAASTNRSGFPTPARWTARSA